MQTIAALTANRIPRNLADFRNLHSAETIIVCGCGTSLNTFKNSENFITIGVNDVGRLFDPTYLVVLNPRHQFKDDRFRYVERSRAQAIFTQLNLGIKHPNIIRFKLGKHGGTDFNDPNSLPYTRNSPYVALCLALHMGAKRIGLIGVDFTEHHFFAETGRHPLSHQLAHINKEYTRLAGVCTKRGVEVVNLSKPSRLTAFPKASVEDFIGAENTRPLSGEQTATLNIVSYATTPVAGVPAILARCINAHTPHNARCVWARSGYGNGVEFNGDIQWTENRTAARDALAAADVVIVHNGKVDPQHNNLLADKAIITMAHNYLWNVDQTFVKQGLPGAVVGQYQATLPEFKNWSLVPNPLPFWEQAYQAEIKPDVVTICYTPSAKHERFAKGHRLYWHAKGYRTTMQTLDRLSRTYPIRLHVIRDRQLSHAEALAMKRRSHIVIDECVTGSYHRNSLEGLAAGCVVINGIGLLPGVVGALHRCTGQTGPLPFVPGSLENLESILVELIESGSASLEKRGAQSRAWMEQHWAFAAQWQAHWLPLIERVFSTRALHPTRSAIAPALRAASGQPARGTPLSLPEKINDSAIPVYWTCRGNQRGNFGDMLSPLLVKALSGRPVKFEQHGPRLFAVGSLLKFTRPGDVVWGSGFIDAGDVCDHRIHVYAVRGPLTRRKLLQAGVDCPEVYGDPALLLPWLYRLPKHTHRGIGIIPHYVDEARVRALVKDPGIRIINIRAGVEQVLHQISRCEILLSSSLHGCVLGDAYAIPSAWVSISDKVVGGGFKFHDYYAGTDRETVCVDWQSLIDIDAGVRAALKTPPVKVNLELLLKRFPFLHRSIQSLADLTARALQGKCRQTPKNTVAAQQILPPTQPEHNKQRATSDFRLAVFSSGTESYLACMVTSLRSFMQHNRQRPFDYYILGHAFSEESRDLLRRYGIRYVDLDIGDAFPREQRDRYPRECFWIFKGPEIFNGMGYDFSLSVDGDIWCNRHLDLDWLPNVEHIAGIDRGGSVADFLSGLGQYPLLKKHFGISDSVGQRRATNSGVLFYNNKALATLGFFERVVKLCTDSEAIGVHRAGDDSTLALLLAVYPEIQLFELEKMWNAYRGLTRQWSIHDPRYNRYLAHWIDEARIVHLAAIKPWTPIKRFPNRVARHFTLAWRKLWQELNAHPVAASSCLPPSHSRARLNNSESKQPFPVRCYWYRGTRPNFGDEVAPYLVKKIAGLSPHVNLRERPRDPRTLSEPVLLSMGSVLRLCAGNAIVWGSGIRNIDQEVAKAKRFSAVRGPLTRRRLLQLGYDCPALYGDPALLLPRYFHPSVPQRYALGIIPHQQDYAQLSKWYARHPEVLVIDVCTSDIEGLIKQVLSCHCTVSTALHGIVVSVAYGVPTRWLRFSDKIMGDSSKFYDFFASLNPVVGDLLDRSSVTLPGAHRELEPYRPIRMQGAAMSPQALAQMTFRHMVTLNLEKLLEACPINENGWKPGVL